MKKRGNGRTGSKIWRRLQWNERKWYSWRKQLWISASLQRYSTTPSKGKQSIRSPRRIAAVIVQFLRLQRVSPFFDAIEVNWLSYPRSDLYESQWRLNFMDLCKTPSLFLFPLFVWFLENALSLSPYKFPRFLIFFNKILILFEKKYIFTLKYWLSVEEKRLKYYFLEKKKKMY